MIKHILIIIILLTFTGCSELNIEKKIVNTIEDNCIKENKCIIIIKELTNFNWDRMYVFKYNTTSEDIRNVIGSTPPHFTEFSRKIIFKLNSSIVHYEEECSNVEGLTNGEVIFDLNENEIYKEYTIEDAVFFGEKLEFDKGVYYKLKQAEN